MVNCTVSELTTVLYNKYLTVTSRSAFDTNQTGYQIQINGLYIQIMLLVDKS